jgi:hypothetical protein
MFFEIVLRQLKFVPRKGPFVRFRISTTIVLSAHANMTPRLGNPCRIWNLLVLVPGYSAVKQTMFDAHEMVVYIGCLLEV